MHFVYYERKEIPVLSWCAVLEKKKEEVSIYHGSWVETQDSFFVEGIWDTLFSEGQFDQSYLLMGSGGKIINQKVIFVSPCHTLERLHYVYNENKLYISNSIAFVLEQSNLSPDINYLHYVTDFASICDGIRDYIKKVPLENNHWLYLSYYQNLVIESDLSVRRMEKSAPPQVSDFASYRQFLVDSLRLLSNNAKDPARHIRYSPLATISRGYDSTACAALAAEVGCKKVLTISGPGKYVHDCGTELAKSMGYEQIIEIFADNYKNKKDKMLEPLFMASGEMGTDCFWAAFEENLPKMFVVIGINGDKVWDANYKSVSSVIKRSSPSATSLGEYRLRMGFIQVPVPYFGCINHPLIHQISVSEEMKPWVLGNNYDRPIPRRIVEEMGIERSQFGNKKIGIGFNMRWDTLYNIKKKMSSHSFNSFLGFYKKNKIRRSKYKMFIQSIKYCLFISPQYYNYIMRHLRLKSRICINFPRRYSDNPFACSFLFLWGIHYAKRDYQTIK